MTEIVIINQNYNEKLLKLLLLIKIRIKNYWKLLLIRIRIKNYWNSYY